MIHHTFHYQRDNEYLPALDGLWFVCLINTDSHVSHLKEELEAKLMRTTGLGLLFRYLLEVSSCCSWPYTHVSHSLVSDP